MSQVTHLASGALNRSGDRLSIELHQPADSPSFVMVVWRETLNHRGPDLKRWRRWRPRWFGA